MATQAYSWDHSTCLLQRRAQQKSQLKEHPADPHPSVESLMLRNSSQEQDENLQIRYPPLLFLGGGRSPLPLLLSSTLDAATYTPKAHTREENWL